VNPWIVVPSLVLVAVVFVLLPVAAAAYSRFRQPWRVPCPVDHAEAEIGVDAVAAARAELVGRRQLSVVRCSFWPERQGCAQGCVDAPLAEWKAAASKHTTLTPA
jgi:hypothetical protein